MLAKLKDKYMALTPKQKTMALTLGVPTILFMLYILTVEKEERVAVPTSNKSEKGTFDTDSQELTVPALSTKFNSLQGQVEMLGQRDAAKSASLKRIEDMLESVSDNDASARTFYEVTRKLAALEEELAAIKVSGANGGQQYANQTTDALQETDSEDTEQTGESDIPIEIESKSQAAKKQFIPDKEAIDYRVTKANIPSDPLKFIEAAVKQAEIQQDTDENVFIENKDGKPVKSVATTVISVDEDAKRQENESNRQPVYKGRRVLAGAVIPFTLINGFDAPTGKANSTDPVSTTVRITGPAKLANGYTVDLTGCLVTNLVKGNEATERASLRPDRLTCKYSYGEVDIAIQGYVSGKDGSAGLRGRLVSKQQKALIYGTIAGIAEGLGNTFGGGNSNSSLGVLGGDPFALPSSDQALRSAATSGFTQGSEFLTDYYKSKLESLYDIIEIKPLITGSIHVLRTFEVKLLDDVAPVQASLGAIAN